MRLNDRSAYFTKGLPDGRVIDVQPWRTGGVALVVSASWARWSPARRYWYGDPVTASVAALAWDGTGTPRWGAGMGC